MRLRLGHGIVLGLVGVLACDAWLATASTTANQTARVGPVSLLSLLEIGPSVSDGKAYGGAACDCHGTNQTGGCAAEATQTCSEKSTACEQPTGQEACTVKLKDHASERDCKSNGCVSIKRKTFEACTTKEKCAGGT